MKLVIQEMTDLYTLSDKHITKLFNDAVYKDLRDLQSDIIF